MLDPKSTPQTKPSAASSNDDLLAELREKTARLAAQVVSRENDKPHRVLTLEDSKPTPESPNSQTVSVAMPAPAHEGETNTVEDPAIQLVKRKLSQLYSTEPDAGLEAAEAEVNPHRSKHQKFMHELTTSGKSLEEIQTAWHDYYSSLPDKEKHQVWQEFYENQSQLTSVPKTDSSPQPTKKPKDQKVQAGVHSQLLDKINAGGKLKPIHHIKSLLFGLGLAAFVGLIMTFTFFNEVFIAPFINPAQAISTTPIIGELNENVGPEPKIIIPKINLEVPVVFDMTTIEESEVQKALESGVVHYASTPNPGEQGNSVIVGHSSNNILNSGKYKFAFVLLKRLEPEDVFFVQRSGIRYAYKVYKKEIVGPDNISVLSTQDRPNTMTLITCDPPGTSINRLIIVAEQISPDPSGNPPSTAEVTSDEPASELPSNSPTLWSRLWPF